MKQMKGFLLFLFLIFSSAIFAQSSMAQLNDLLSSFHSMSATFQQKTIVKNGVAKSSSGTMAIKRPGRFRWEITNPNHQVIIAQGPYLWIYDVDLEQATRKSLTKDTSNTAVLLSGSSSAIEQRFSIVHFDEKGERMTFRLKPKTHQDMFQRVDLEFTHKKLSQMTVIDNLGQKNIFYFSNVKLNPSLSNSLFQFHAPNGVDVITE